MVLAARRGARYTATAGAALAPALLGWLLLRKGKPPELILRTLHQVHW